MERVGRTMPTLSGLAAFFGVDRDTISDALRRSEKLRDALDRGKANRSGRYLRRQQQLSEGYWYCAKQVDEKGRVICRHPLEEMTDECPAHPGKPPLAERAFAPPHVIAGIWVGKNQFGWMDRSPLETPQGDVKKLSDDELTKLAREALLFQGEDPGDEPVDPDEDADREDENGPEQEDEEEDPDDEDGRGRKKR